MLSSTDPIMGLPKGHLKELPVVTAGRTGATRKITSCWVITQSIKRMFVGLYTDANKRFECITKQEGIDTLRAK